MQLSDFEKSLLTQKLIAPKDKILIACSGGPDSVALLHFLVGLQKKWKFKIGVLHFDHQLRGPASKRDAIFVRNLARKNKLRFYSGSASVKKMAAKQAFSIEEAARKLRYNFFCKTAVRLRFSKIATAHTQNDQAETVLMRMVQGTGLRGLCGIRPQTVMGKTIFVRPLLFFPKKEILKYLKENKIAFRVDASNDSLRFVRNKIRNKILPVLERELNPKTVLALSRIPLILNAESEALDLAEAHAWKRVFRQNKKGAIHFRRRIYLDLPEALQFRVLEKALKTLDPASGLNFEAWQQVRRELGKKYGRHSLPKDIDFALTPKAVGIYKKFFTASRK